MPSGTITCSRCGAPWPTDAFNRPQFVPCSSCEAPTRVEVFPAFFRTIQPGRAGENILVEGESACFYHPQKRAAVPCEGCGRFLCALCDCELNGQHLCPTCLETGQRKGRLKTLQNHRTLYDNTALALAVVPLLLFYLTIVTAPMVLYVALRYWNAPSSLIPRSKVRFIAAVVLASLQILGWAAGIWYLAWGRS